MRKGGVQLKLVRCLGMGTAVLLLLALFALPASGQAKPATATGQGCQGSATAFDAGGKQVGSVATGGQASPETPLVVDYDGSVRWQGSTSGAIKKLTWDVKLFGVTLAQGSAEKAGSPVGTVPWVAATLLSVVGLAVLATALPRARKGA